MAWPFAAAARTAGRAVATACMTAALIGAVWASRLSLPWVLVCYLAGALVAVVPHEMGHFLCARALKVPVLAVYVGAPPGIAFSAGKVRVHVGLGLRGRVQTGPASRGRRAAFIAAGPLANLATAGAALTLARQYPVAGALAWTWAGTGVANLVPFQTTAGRWSDGANLIRVATGRDATGNAPKRNSAAELLRRPAEASMPGEAGRLLAETSLGAAEAIRRAGLRASELTRSGRVRELLALHNTVRLPPGVPDDARIQVVHVIEYMVLTIPGLSRDVADAAAERVEWVCAHEHRPEHQRAARITLALARLRQHRYEQVEPLCADALAGELTAEQRATVLAAIVLARRAAGLPAEPILAEARGLAPEAGLVVEAASSDPGPR